MTEQLDLFEFEEHEDSFDLITTGISALEGKGFKYLLPLGTGKKGHSAFRGIFEEKPCTVHIDNEGYVMFRHDDSRFFDYYGQVKI